MNKNYEEFIGELRLFLLNETGYTEDKIYFRKKGEKMAENGDRLFLVRAEEDGMKEICGVHVQELFEDYERGKELNELGTMILTELKKVNHAEFFDKTKNLTDYEMIKKDLFIRLLNLNRNKDELVHAVYRCIGDIAVVLYMRISESADGITSMKIRKEYLEEWGISREKILEEALINTMKMTPPRIYCWEKLIFDPEYDGEDFMGKENSDVEISRKSLGICLSTTKRTNGAAAIFMPGVAKRMAELLGQDLYLAFTSVHEVMVHDARQVYPEELEDVVSETVKETTPEEDFLSIRIYRYCRSTDSIICVSEDED